MSSELFFPTVDPATLADRITETDKERLDRERREYVLGVIDLIAPGDYTPSCEGVATLVGAFETNRVASALEKMIEKQS